jgi:threonine/homoserine/homoserine lactone efflux protein
MDLFFFLLGTAALLGGLHMIAPDHWAPLAVVSRKLKYTGRKTYLTAASLGAIHAITSEAIAGLVLVIGVLLVHRYLGYVEIASIILLFAVGIYFIVNGVMEIELKDDQSNAPVKSILAISAFPDLALIPIILAGSALSLLEIGLILAVFIIVSSISLTVMSYLSTRGLAGAMEKIPPRYIDYVMGLILFLTAIIIIFTS